MKKIILVLSLLLLPIFAQASIDQNLYYGMLNNDGVKQLQQYLITKGFLNIQQPTGNFGPLTLAAVKKYQATKNITTTGVVGPITRKAINTDLSSAADNTSPNQNLSSNSVNTTVVAPFTGTLDLSTAASYSNLSIIPPQSKFKLADFFLKNNTTEAINLKTIEIDLATSSDLYITNLYVSKLYVVYANNKTVTVDTVSHNNYWTINYQLPVGQTIDLSVYGDVNSSIPLGSVVNASLLVTGASSVTSTTVSTNSNAVLSGQNITFGASSLTVGPSNFTPISRLVVSGQKVIGGVFQFSASSDSYVVSQLKFIVPGSILGPIVLDAFLSDDNNQILSTAMPAPDISNVNNYVFSFNINLPISLNSSKNITLNYDLVSAIDSKGTSINISPVLVYVKASNSNGTLIDGAVDNNRNIVSSYGGISLPPSGITVNDIYVFRSLPTFKISSPAAIDSNNPNVNVYTFNIGADPKGDISVKQIIFSIAITDPNGDYPYLNRFTLFKGNVDYTGSVIIGTIVNNSYVGLTTDKGIGVGTSTVILTFNKEETIPAGKNQTYTLKAYPNNFKTSSFSTSIVPDTHQLNNKYLRMAFTNIYGLSATPTDTNITNYNFLWSDKSALAFFTHSDLNGFSTDDWYNGFGVTSSP